MRSVVTAAFHWLGLGFGIKLWPNLKLDVTRYDWSNLGFGPRSSSTLFDGTFIVLANRIYSLRFQRHWLLYQPAPVSLFVAVQTLGPIWYWASDLFDAGPFWYKSQCFLKPKQIQSVANYSHEQPQRKWDYCAVQRDEYQHIFLFLERIRSLWLWWLICMLWWVNLASA